MARYFFDVEDGRLVVADEEGHELPGIEDAESAALALLADLVKQGNPNGRRRNVEVRVREDESPCLVASLSLLITRNNHPVS
jgi:hypothetical protein